MILLTQVLSITLATGPRRIASRSAGVSCSTIALLPHPREESSSRMASVARYSSRRDSRTGSKALWMDSGPGVAVGVRPADDDRGVRSRGVASPPMRAGESTPFRASQAAEGPTPTERANGRPNRRVELKTAAVEKRGRKGLTKTLDVPRTRAGLLARPQTSTEFSFLGEPSQSPRVSRPIIINY